MNRRRFLNTGTAALASGLAAGVHAAAPVKAPRVGLIGCGWYGKCDLFRLLQVQQDAQVTGLCDVDSAMLSEAAALVSGRQASGKVPSTFGDYREMLKQQQFDIVLVDTPDHWHALPTIAAIEHGADVWVQKPISVDIAEGQAMLSAARRHSRVVQVGTQRRSTPHLIEARDRVVSEGLLGDIGLVEIYCYYHMRNPSNPPDGTPPETLDFEMWTGPAPMRPYNSLVHPRGWRAFMEYCNGIVGDMCIHMYDMVRWMLDLGWPTSISSNGGILVQTDAKANTTDTQTAVFEHPDFPVVWTHRTWGDPPDRNYPWGATIYGSKGTLKMDVDKYDFTPHRGGKPLHGDAVFDYDRYPEDETEKDLERHVASAIRGHMRNFLDCIDSREKPVADIEQGHISTASCILANISLEVGRSLAWDPQTHAIPGDSEANNKLRRPYRAPWKHPAG
ncbi:MAG: Gfo/Idh/MocA family oxidoreductase [Planctomycetaceae bacterium]|nr:Gfo/Idh/MocA family oxidoreductase [Planctomycetaceae bacterium]